MEASRAHKHTLHTHTHTDTHTHTMRHRNRHTKHTATLVTHRVTHLLGLSVPPCPPRPRTASPTLQRRADAEHLRPCARPLAHARARVARRRFRGCPSLGGGSSYGGRARLRWVIVGCGRCGLGAGMDGGAEAACSESPPPRVRRRGGRGRSSAANPHGESREPECRGDRARRQSAARQ